MDPDQLSLIRIYVNDHRAASEGGRALARRCQRSNRGTALGTEMSVIVADFEFDANALETVATELEVPNDPIKRLLSRAGELVGRLKTNGRLREYSPLSRLLELELLMAGIDAKRSLWRALGSSVVAEVSACDFDELERRASDQRARIRPFHLEAAREAFGDAP